VKIEQTLWVEKYRPRKLEDLVLPEYHRNKMRGYIESRIIPNLLFSGSPGGGKSTLARIITSTNGILNNPKDNALIINGSAKETRNINFVDTVIEPFLKIPPAGKDRWRIVFIDECDYLTDAAFNSLRGIIEKYQQKFGRFICTCNYLSKVPEPIQSRFTSYIFKQIPIEFVGHYCKKILNIENIKYDDSDLKFVIDSLYPDVRRIIDFLQDNSIGSQLNVDKNSILTTERLLISSMVEICNYIKGGETHKINKVVGITTNLLDEHDLEYRSVYTQLFFNKDISVAAKIVINKYANSHKDCLVASMHFMGLVLEFVQTLSKYQQTVKEK